MKLSIDFTYIEIRTGNFCYGSATFCVAGPVDLESFSVIIVHWLSMCKIEKQSQQYNT